MRVLFLARQPPVPLDNGERLRTHALAKSLSSVTSLHFLAFDALPAGDQPRQDAAAVAAALVGAKAVALVPAPSASKRRLQLQTVLGGRSYGFETHKSRSMAQALLRAVDTFKPDLLHCDSLLLGDIARLAPPSVVRTIAPHNVESQLMGRMAETTDARARRMLYTREAALLGRWEAAHLAEFDLCLGVSEEDANLFARLGANAVCIPNGVDRHPPPSPVSSLRPDEPLRLLYVGTGDFEPSRVGMAWFVKDVLPEVSCRISPRLTVVGSGWDWLDHPLCECVGHVPSLGSYYATHHVALVPPLSGGGSRLKVAEALAKGLPLLGTTVGLEGYSLQPGVHALFGDTPEDMAAHIQWLDESLRVNTDPVNRQVAAGFHLVQQFFWDEICGRMADLYADAARTTVRRRPIGNEITHP